MGGENVIQAFGNLAPREVFVFGVILGRIQTAYKEILRISPYSVRMREKADQNNSEYGQFLRSVSVSISRKVWWAVRICSFFENWDILQTRIDNGGMRRGIKMNFEYSQIQKWMLQAVRAGKVNERNEVNFLVSICTSWVMVRKLSKKKWISCNFVLPLSNKSKSIKVIYIYASESSHYAF